MLRCAFVVTLFTISYSASTAVTHLTMQPKPHHPGVLDCTDYRQSIASIGAPTNDTSGLMLWFYQSQDESTLRIVENYEAQRLQIQQKTSLPDLPCTITNVTFHALQYLLIVSRETALSHPAEYRHGDIVQINNLNKQQNTTLQQIVRFMNNSYGIVMEYRIKVIRNTSCITLQWIMSNKTCAAIKPKYLTKSIPNIYIYQNTTTAAELSQQLISDEFKNVVILINELPQILNYNARNVQIGPIAVYSCALRCLYRMNDINLPTLLNTLALVYYHAKQSANDIITPHLTALMNWRSPFPSTGGLVKVGSDTIHIPNNYHLAKKIHRRLNEVLGDFYDAMSRNDTDKRTIFNTFWNTIQRSEMKGFINLKKHELKQFWKLFYHEFSQIVLDIINGLLMDAQLHQGTSITLDIVNTYLMDPTRDLHIICSEQSVLEKLHYDVIVEKLAAHLRIGMARYRTHLAKAIIKRVTS
eukprot:44613_1